VVEAQGVIVLPPEAVTRRLSAILAADMVGYSRLMEADEAGTLARQKTYFNELIRPKIDEYEGRIVKTTGDGLLAEFPSAVGAVLCAVDVQRGVEGRERDVSESQRIAYRVGINVGDIIHDEDDIFGEGVNVAARLEESAPAGGICISGAVYDTVKGKLDLGFVGLGQKIFKNIAEPIESFQVLLDAENREQALEPARSQTHWLKVAAAILAAAVVGGGVWVASEFWPSGPVASEMNKPSLAVLPLDNLSGDSSQDWFAKGLSEDLTTDLSRHPGLFVIARNSAFAAAEDGDDPIRVAKMLKVGFVVEGSVRRVGDSLRLNVQLIDAGNGGHIWAERYDGTSEDVLHIMDNVAESLLEALEVDEVIASAAAPSGETNNPQAFDAFLEGWNLYRQNTPDDLKQAIPFFEKATELDPEYGRAHAALAATYFRIYEKSWQDVLGYNFIERRFVYQLAQEKLDTALEYPTGLAHQTKAQMLRLRGEKAGMLEQARAAVDLEPGDPNGRDILGLALILHGKPDEALAEIKVAMELDPHYPAHFLLTQGMALFDKRKYDEALAVLTRANLRNPMDPGPYYWLAATHAYLGDIEKANEVRRQDANHGTRDGMKLYVPYAVPEPWLHLEEGMRRAGYP
jgi:TolB-like protein/class 3 adenylate cyclase/Flp pilus assembly protein TadD